jgi:enoyl-[acyl-carrier-protein] reductase (NADH)
MVPKSHPALSAMGVVKAALETNVQYLAADSGRPDQGARPCKATSA